MKRLRRIEIIAFRRRTIVVGETERSPGASADQAEEVSSVLAELSVAVSTAAKGGERSTSNNRLSQITRRALSRAGTTLNILRHSRSNIYGGPDEH
ncbi:MAG TPA: hypothetical protein VKF81_14965 [Blastocatellia bacterium]|nr:hypothetical protein [Blastocatellia bacterium]